MCRMWHIPGPSSSLHSLLEGLQLLVGDKGLDGTGKSAAVDPDGAGAASSSRPTARATGMALLLRGRRRPGVLQVQGGGQPRLVHQGQEGGKVALLQGLGLLLRPAVLLKEVHGPKHRPVAALLPQLGQGGPEGPLVHVPQELLAEMGGHRAHFPG